jgi:hypothetical protein
MQLEEQARIIALFFYFAFLDERLAGPAAERAVGALKAAHGSNRGRGFGAAGSDDERDARIRLIQVCKRRFDIEKASMPSDRARRAGAATSAAVAAPASVSASPPPSGGAGGQWRIPPGADLAAWSKFSRAVSEDERLAIAFAHILKFAQDEIADGLSISLGTLRHRLGRAARSLGAIAVARAKASP